MRKSERQSGREAQWATLYKDLSKGWPCVKLGDVVESMKNGIYKPASAYADDGVACLRMYNIGDGGIVWRDIKRMRLTDAELRDYELLPGDLLVNRVNSRELVGKAAAIPDGLERCVFESKNIRVRLRRDKVIPEFVSYCLLFSGSEHFRRNAQQVVGMASISQPQVASFPLPLPPLDQQRRIVATIDEQFSRLDAGVAALRRAQANLKRYRAAVLKAACEGRLVPAEARLSVNGGTTYPDGGQLLRLILEARRENWTEVVRYREPGDVAEDHLTPLPAGWVWTTLDALLREPLRNGHSAKASTTGIGLRAFTLSAVTEGDFSARNTKITSAEAAKVRDLWAEPGDIFVERSNTPELVGTARLYSGPPNFAFIPDLLIRVRTTPLVSSRYVELCLQSQYSRKYLCSRAKGIAGSMPKVDQGTIQSLPVPLPPMDEQRSITADADRRFSVADGVEAAIIAELRRAKRLQQAILQRAFSGGLAA